MLNIYTVTNLNNPELEFYKTLRLPKEHLKQGVFISEGEKVVQRLLMSDIEITSILITPTWFAHYKTLLEQRPESITVFIAEKSLMETIVGFHLHQGIMALSKIPQPNNIDTILKEAQKPYLFVAVDGLTNAENLGVIVRNCAGFGVQALLVGETSSSPYLRRAVRNSMGSIFRMQIVQCENLVNTLRYLKEYKFRIIGAHPHSGNNTIQNVDLTTNCCIVLGSEGAGISSAVLSACDISVSIPMQNGIDSLNVASANAIFLYEVYRQRNKK